MTKTITQQSILWHDYETWGVNPQKDFPCQFAAIRTDLDLQEVGKPINWYCQIPNDYLPHPQAALVTGITPQQTLRDGLIEAEFISKIESEMSVPGTCVAGYNSIRFDDEVTRFTLYRNLRDPYAREWQNGNSRWDIIDLVRACYALRPDGIEWVYRDDGSPSFKLDQLTQANGIDHLDAHDALSDVRATIAMAARIKSAQPKLFQFLFDLRFKHKVSELIRLDQYVPLVHVSSKLPANQGCCSWILPIAMHPVNKNAVICLNLAVSPEPLFSLGPEQIREKLYTASVDLADGETRLPIKLVHINKCPVLAPAKALTEQSAERLGIDRQACLEHLASIKQHPHLRSLLVEVFQEDENRVETQDPDNALYSGGFFSDADSQRMKNVLATSPEKLGSVDWQFDDPRLDTLLFRLRARNFPHTLDQQELLRWQRHREYRLTDPGSPASIKMPDYMMELEHLAQSHQNNPDKQAIIRALYQYAQNL